jgi:Protein of unknown function (DUF3102)
MEAPLTESNYLPELAGRIRAEHTAVADTLKDSLRHAITAGELLIVAKAQVPHGQWLSWLREHCAVSERTEQFYMRVAKNRAEIEAKISEDAADVTLSEAAAVLALSSDARRLFRFVKELEALDDPEETPQACLAANVPVIVDENYNPFAGRTEQETAEWWLFVTFLTCDFAARRTGMKPNDAWQHVDHLLQKSFQNVSEWLGPEGEKFRKLYEMRAPKPSKQFKQAWQAFLAEHGGKSSAEARSEAEAVAKRFRQDMAAGRLKSLRRFWRKRTHAA